MLSCICSSVRKEKYVDVVFMNWLVQELYAALPTYRLNNSNQNRKLINNFDEYSHEISLKCHFFTHFFFFIFPFFASSLLFGEYQWLCVIVWVCVRGHLNFFSHSCFLHLTAFRLRLGFTPKSIKFQLNQTPTSQMAIHWSSILRNQFTMASILCRFGEKCGYELALFYFLLSYADTRHAHTHTHTPHTHTRANTHIHT